MTITLQKLLAIFMGTVLALALLLVCSQSTVHAASSDLASSNCKSPCAAASTFYGSNKAWMKTATSDWWEQQDTWCGIANIRAIQRYDWLYYNGGSPKWDNSQQAIFNRLNGNTSPWGAGGGGVRANISRDFGTDPRAIAYGAWYDTPASTSSQPYWFHNWIYRTNAVTAVMDFSSDFGTNTVSHNDPISVTIDGGYHSFVVDGVFASSDPSRGSTTIQSIDTWDPWLNSANAARDGNHYYNQTQNQVWSLYDWTHTNKMWGQPYDNGNNTGSDPDPDTSNHYYVPPFPGGYAHHWNTYYVTIEQDRINDASTSHDYAIGQDGHLAPHN